MEVELPDGTVVEFPDGTPPEVMERAIKDFLGTKAEPLSTPSPAGTGSVFGHILDLGVTRFGAPAVKAVGEFLGREPVTGQAGKPLPELFDPTAGVLQSSDKGTGTSFFSPERIVGGPAGRLSLELMKTSDPQRRAKMINETIPGTKAFADPQGNVIIDVTRDGQTKRAILNQRGMSLQDVNDTLGEVLQFVGIGRLAGVGNLFKQGAKVAASIFGLETAKAEKPFSPESLERAGVNSLAGFVFVTGGGALFRKIRELQRRRQFVRPGPNRTAQLSNEGKQALRDAGINPDDLTEPTIRELAKILPKAGNVQEAVRLAEARGLNVRLTRGEVTQNPARLGREDQAVKLGGELSPEAATLRAFKTEGQPAELTEAARAAGRAVTGREISPVKGSSFSDVQPGLLGKKVAAKREITAAFDVAKSTTARLEADAVKPLRQQFREIAREFRTFPQLQNVVKRLSAATNPKQGTVALKTLEDFRKELVALQGSSDRAIVAGATRLKRAYDQYMTALASGRFGAMFSRGGPADIKAFKKAIALRAKFGQKFEDNPILERLLRFEPRAQKPTLAMSPEESVDLLFGAGIGKSQTAAALRALSGVLGRNSRDFNAIKAEQLTRLFKTGKTNALETGSISGARLASNLDDLLLNRPDVAKALYSADDIRFLRTLRRVAETATVRRADIPINRSNTAIMRVLNLPRVPAWIKEAFARTPGFARFRGGGKAVSARLALDERRLLTPRRPGAGLLAAPAVSQDVDLPSALSLTGRLLQGQ